MSVITKQPNKIGPEGLINEKLATFPQLPTSPYRIPANLIPLANSTRVMIKQKKELFEILCGIEMENKYEIFDDQNFVIYSVQENSDCCTRMFCGPNRELTVDIRSRNGSAALFLKRPFKCGNVCCPCGLQLMSVHLGQGIDLGTIQQIWTFKPQLHVLDESNNIIFVIRGPYCPFSCCNDVEFPIFAPDGKTELGMISKKWVGFLNEAFTDADAFGVKFPIGIDVRKKALLVGATFLIDYMFFESANQGWDFNFM